MALPKHTTVRRPICTLVAGAVVFAAFAVASSGPASGQETGDPPAAFRAETMALAGMRMMMGAAGDGSDADPLMGHGFLLDRDVFITIDHPDAVSETAVFGINNRGRIVGAYTDAEGTIHSFLLDDGVFTPIDHPDAGSGPAAGTIAFGLNDRGQIVGAYIDGEEATHGFLLDNGHGFRRAEGVFTTIDHPAAALGAAPFTDQPFTAAFGIDDRGRIVGSYFDAGGTQHGFVRDKGDGARRHKGDLTTIDHPDAVATAAMAINNRGQILGRYVDAEGTYRGFLLDEGDFTPIDHPDATTGTIDGASTGTLIFGLNNREQVVGQYMDTDLRCHGFLLKGGTFSTIDDPDALSATGAADINDRGQIVGFHDGATGLAPCTQGASTSPSDAEPTDEYPVKARSAVRDAAPVF